MNVPFICARVIAAILVVVPFFFQGPYSDSRSLLPGGFFILIRWIVCPVLAVLAYRAYKAQKIAWTWVFGIDAAIFNPIFLTRLGKLWLVVDLATAGLLLVSFFFAFSRNPRD